MKAELSFYWICDQMLFFCFWCYDEHIISCVCVCVSQSKRTFLLANFHCECRLVCFLRILRILWCVNYLHVIWREREKVHTCCCVIKIVFSSLFVGFNEELRYGDVWLGNSAMCCSSMSVFIHWECRLVFFFFLFLVERRHCCRIPPEFSWTWFECSLCSCKYRNVSTLSFLGDLGD